MAALITRGLLAAHAGVVATHFPAVSCAARIPGRADTSGGSVVVKEYEYRVPVER